ncbi:MAG: formate dehydrogenase accessory sulfurtransferase FdhD [Gammaproteobacteria bacterium]|nr:formate dehydrogenase accessory sulfurtransferase FdhD [Gammaproteobacteria bacterium]
MPTPVTHPLLSDAGLRPIHPATVRDETGAEREVHIAGEHPLTLYVDKREVVTLMTLGTHPEALVLGFLRNQSLVDDLAQLVSVQVDWDVEAAAVTTRNGRDDWDAKLAKRTVTSGCGQGTQFGNLMERIDATRLPPLRVRQSLLYELLATLGRHDTIYKAAGAVHACALCRGSEVLYFVEDVGRHNALDAIAGQMWLDGVGGGDCILYTTGRVTSEMVIKATQMGVPILLSRSGMTQMGLDLGRRVDMLLVARAKGRHFLVFHGADRIEFDAADG